MSDLGNLSQCMMDDAREARTRRQGSRLAAVAASVCLQVIVMAALIVWPLLSPPALPKTVAVTPMPPYHGMPVTTAAPAEESPSQAPATATIVPVFTQPVRVPPHTTSASSAQPPTIAQNPAGTGNGPGAGPWIPGGSGNGPVVIEQPAPPPRVVRRSEGVMAASLVNRVEPLYPAPARAAHISGMVRLRAIIGTDGSVQQIEVISGNGILARAAVAAVREWRYRPTLLNGQPVEVETEMSVDFTLE